MSVMWHMSPALKTLGEMQARQYSLSTPDLRLPPRSPPNTSQFSSDAPAVLNSNSGGRFNNNSKTEQKLMEHIKNRDMRGIEKSIAYGASVITSTYKSDPPIMVAIDCGYKDITKLLLEHKQLDVNERARNGYTPLGYAAMNGKTDIVKVLLKEKALINAMDAHGETALIKAVTHGNVAASELLLNKGADPNILAGSGYAALHIAVAKSNVSIVKILLKEKSLKIDLENKDKLTALQMLKKTPNEDIKHLIVISTASRSTK